MKVYFSGYFTSPDLAKMVGDFGVLVSYLEVRGKKRIPIIGRPVFLDSGAFSVFTGKAKINIKEYADFLLRTRHFAKIYANLDVIGDAEATEKNQHYLESQGLTPLATFHFGSPYSILEKMIDEYNYFGLGGLVPLARKKNILFAHLDKCFSIILKHSDLKKIHGWGMTGMDVLFKYPFFSVDSTSWLMGGKFRQKFSYSFDGLGDTRGIEARIMKYHSINIHNAKNILQMVQDATLLWEKRGITWND